MGVSDTHKRSLAKGVTWRALATATTMGVVYIFTESVALVASVGVLDAVAKVLLYYFHERVWNRVVWGVVPVSRRR